PEWGQRSGRNFAGSTVCDAGLTSVWYNDFYSQCNKNPTTSWPNSSISTAKRSSSTFSTSTSSPRTSTSTRASSTPSTRTSTSTKTSATSTATGFVTVLGRKFKLNGSPSILS
ncbi:hypothetical protein FRC16_007157, partial [Serendipita sp. 398]